MDSEKNYSMGEKKHSTMGKEAKAKAGKDVKEEISEIPPPVSSSGTISTNSGSHEDFPAQRSGDIEDPDELPVAIGFVPQTEASPTAAVPLGPGAFHVWPGQSPQRSRSSPSAGAPIRLEDESMNRRGEPTIESLPTFEGRVVPPRRLSNMSRQSSVTTVSATNVVPLPNEPSDPEVDHKADKNKRLPWCVFAVMVIGVAGVALAIAFTRSRSQNPAPRDANATAELGDSLTFHAQGKPIIGPTDKPGLTFSFSADGKPQYSYSHTKSNATFTGLSTALSGDGLVLAVGQPGVDTIRTFRWDDEVGDWAPMAEDIVLIPDCLDVYNNSNADESDIFDRSPTYNQGTSSAQATAGIVSNGSVRRALLRQAPRDDAPPRHLRQALEGTASTQADAKQWLPCFSAFGFVLELSRDGSILVASAIGLNETTGLVRTYRLQEVPTSDGDGAVGPSRRWVQFGQDLMGDAHYDIFGSTLRLTPDGQTLVAAASQGVHPTFAASLGMRPFAGRGYLRVYDWNESSGLWGQRGRDIVGRERNSSIASADITDDGSRLVIGTLFGGYVERYAWANEANEWALLGPGLEGPIGEQDFGVPVRFASPDGSRIIISSQFMSDGPTASANLIYLFDVNSDDSWDMLDRLVVLSGEPHEVKRHHLAITPRGERLVTAFSSGVLIFDLDGATYRYKRTGGPLEGGRRVAISNSGSVIGVGRPFDISAGVGTGSVSAYHESD